MSSGGKVALVVVLLAVAGFAGWYWYNNYGAGAGGGTGAAPSG